MSENTQNNNIELNKKGTLTRKQFRVLLLVLTSVALAAVVALMFVGYYFGWWGGIYGVHGYDGKSYSVKTISSAQLSIHFLQTYGGNGDCIYVKVGETDVLIDAGASASGAAAIAQYVDRYCTDGVLEYVVATHADSDHISGFAGTSTVRGIFKRYDCRTIIQFSNTNSTSDVLTAFCQARDDEISRGARCYTALQCYLQLNGAQKVYDLGNGVTMEVLYQRYYEENTAEENDCSVCLLIKQGDKSFLFTGDLEAAGEEALLASNPTLGEVTVYKGGHHGSSSSASLAFLNVIRPQYVCICCNAGSVEYTQNSLGTFPSQDFIDRVSLYTDNVYVTGQARVAVEDGRQFDVGYGALNGDVVFCCTDGEISAWFSASDSKLRDTDWFLKNRRMPEVWSRL